MGQTPIILLGDHGQTLPKQGYSIFKVEKYGKENDHYRNI